MDRGYLDFAWLARRITVGVFSVTRPKHNTAYEVVEVRSGPERSLTVADEVVRLTGTQAQRDCPHLLRRIEAVVPKTGELVTLLTNHLAFTAATTIAAIYKDRWQIELLFKALKQSLKIKTIVGTTPNALHIQTWTAVIALLRMNLFVHRDLWHRLNEPFERTPDIPQPVQAALAFA